MENLEYLVDDLIKIAIAEDLGDGDHTSLSTIPADEQGAAQLIIKQDGILAGIWVALKVFNAVDPALKVELLLKDGAQVKKGDIAFKVRGKVISILQAERLVLNFMQRLSGVATQTHIYASKIADLHTKVLDTRKTTPGMRLLEKQAVKIGGGENHRIGLFDMILIKDNHVDFAGGIENAIRAAQNYCKAKGKNLDIEIETRNLDEIRQAMAVGGIRRIMLDNFDVEQTRKAVELIGGKYETESSGGITLDTLRDYALTGVDYISVGALTHQIKSLDMSLKAIEE
ncbi:MAG: carboxylating nicotinate-nucleotide diphosphorylase [Bacteroidales bacterium]|nr:carboxylating nicotinate-nucleotide diphosphorylase [Bacteroidales bacterium]MBO7461484.1 carboxylating nicotinate-nucleotide diphosphorylase [Bacteroidales bacterium]